ncbi:hypothetical protein ACI79G_09985 [Geodermatophilus sp. SYSU D00779]
MALDEPEASLLSRPDDEETSMPPLDELGCLPACACLLDCNAEFDPACVCLLRATFESVERRLRVLDATLESTPLLELLQERLGGLEALLQEIRRLEAQDRRREQGEC